MVKVSKTHHVSQALHQIKDFHFSTLRHLNRPYIFQAFQQLCDIATSQHLDKLSLGQRFHSSVIKVNREARVISATRHLNRSTFRYRNIMRSRSIVLMSAFLRGLPINRFISSWLTNEYLNLHSVYQWDSDDVSSSIYNVTTLFSQVKHLCIMLKSSTRWKQYVLYLKASQSMQFWEHRLKKWRIY